jgi:hypothetical protein
MKQLEFGNDLISVREMTVADSLRFSALMESKKESSIFDIFLLSPVEDSIRKGDSALDLSRIPFSVARDLFVLFYEENVSFFFHKSESEKGRLIMQESSALTLGALFHSQTTPQEMGTQG